MKKSDVSQSLPHTLNAEFIENQYQLWQNNPQSVTRDWQFFFQGFELGNTAVDRSTHVDAPTVIQKQLQVNKLISRYREIGHLLACLDPLAECRLDNPLLDLEAFGLKRADLESAFYTDDLPLPETAPLKDIIDVLRATYGGSVGIEYMHLQDPDERKWLREKMEPVQNRPDLNQTEKIRILNKLFQVQLFEKFLNKKYLGQTRFSIEGADAVVPMLDFLIEHAAEKEIQEIILGMSHRGRLSVQTDNLGKSYEEIFTEFENSYDPDTITGAGDVKYHKGYLARVTTMNNRPIEILLVNNSSHLESVNPVVEGIARARQERLGRKGTLSVLPLILHGDAAFAGQGITAETLNMSQLEGYSTGGTIHIVINNQIGYTTLPKDARSTRYSTDIAKMLMVPIFHVHGEDPETAAHIVRLACDYRNTFRKDVVLDIVCYRRYGHNEGDEPYFTQPEMYNRIKTRPALSDIYAKRLKAEGITTDADVEKIQNSIQADLEAAYETAHNQTKPFPQMCFYEGCEEFNRTPLEQDVTTAVSEDRLKALGEQLTTIPEGFKPHPKLKRLLARRGELIAKDEGIDWATAESIAFGSLIEEGIPVRLSGQDCRRGTFSQRHSSLVDIGNENIFVPYSHLASNQEKSGPAQFMAYDSSLSEAGILGFEYGYSLVNLDGLTLWEAQFGDFANNAQSIIDLYIAGGEAKWQVKSGLVLLLPHGYEGQGPEHSSARLERFLQLCAEENLRVCYPSTPAQYFHLLRRQVLPPIRKPLIVMTPKSLLRHPRAVSRLTDFSKGRFNPVLLTQTDDSKIKRLLLCSGKLYYELMEKLSILNQNDTAIVRIEQLYPFPQSDVAALANKYTKAQKWFWIQEEPENMGAWRFIKSLLENTLQTQIKYIGRPAAASSATGLSIVYKKEQPELVEKAFDANL